MYLGLVMALGGQCGLEAKVWIQEFMASNDETVLDEDGNSEDWIELYNDAETEVDLSGWILTDDINDSSKWIFPPGVRIQGKERLLVFASGKNRRIAGSELHTNFSLGKFGEYLGLIKADGVTVEHDYAPEYPVQITDVSYGRGSGISSEVVVEMGSSGQAGVPTSASDFTNEFQNWNDLPVQTFTGSTWRDVVTGIGFDRGASNDYGQWIGATGDFETEMWEQNSSIFLRAPFSVPDASKVTKLTLKMRYDDGFVAYINGVKVAEGNAPANLEWDSQSSQSRPDGLNESVEFHEIDLSTVTLVDGTNIFAIHGLNFNETSSDMLVLPRLEVDTEDDSNFQTGYLLSATPGVANADASSTVGPVIRDATEQVERPIGGAGSDPLLITANVIPGSNPINTVRLYYRIMFSNEVPLTMRDDGTGGDLVASDNVYTVMVPTTSLEAGEMIRWRIEASDENDVMRTSPAFLDPADADRYYGTAAVNPTHTSSNLPILELFVEGTSAKDTRSGTRCSVYYLGEFYDNLQIDLHGQSTSQFPKKSHDIDFNKGNRFLWKDGERRVKDINLLTNWADKSKVRNTLTYEYFRRTGTAYHYAFPVRVEQNGSFFAVSDMVEDGDDRYLDRLGLDENGALYKMYDKLQTVAGGFKQTRRDEGKEDLQALIDAMNSGSSSTKRRYAYDNVDIAAVTNYLAAYHTAGVADFGHKNYYLYRDTEGNGEWRFLPWDIDLSLGRKWVPGLKYFDDTLYTNIGNWYNSNPFFALMHDTGEFKDMFLRRCATLRNEVFQANGGGDWISDEILSIRQQIGNDADLDYTEWGSWGNNFTMTQATDRIMNSFLPARRNFLNSNSFSMRGTSVPAYSAPTSGVTFSTLEVISETESPDSEYFTVKNSLSNAVDISGWIVSGAVDYTFPPGTVIPAGAGNAASQYRGLIYVTRSSNAFRTRGSGPQGNEYRFIQEGYSGRLSARGETLELRDRNGVLVDTLTYQGAPTDAQLGLRVTEINYHPMDPTVAESSALPGVTAEDFEFIELQNISGASLELQGTTITEGISFTFNDPLSLPAGAYVIVAKNPDAFTIRYPGNISPVVGPFIGQLDNDGEKLRFLDGFGENVVNFEYNDRWYPPSDGGGRSLVLREVTTAYDGLDSGSVWAASSAINGSPGASDASFLVHYNAWQEEQFDSLLWETIGAPLADPDNDGKKNWEEYAFGLDPMSQDNPIFQGSVVNDGGFDYLAVQARRRMNASDLNWFFESGSDLDGWADELEVVMSRTENVDGTEDVILRDDASIGSNDQKFLRLRVQYEP